MIVSLPLGCGSAAAWDLLQPQGCETTGIRLGGGVELALNVADIVNVPSIYFPASTSHITHTIRFLGDVLAAKEAIDEVGDSNAVVPYDDVLWPVRRPADPQNIANEDYPLVLDGRSEIGFIPILTPLFAAALPMIVYDEASCAVVETDVWLSTFGYNWAFGRPGDHGDSYAEAGLCVGGAIAPGLGCGLFSPNQPIFARPVLVHMLLAVLGFDANIGQHSFRNNGTYPWQWEIGLTFDPRLILLPDDRAGLRAHYPASAPAGEIDVAVVNTHPDAQDMGRNKVLCRPGIGWISAPSVFGDFCSSVPPPATACGGDVVNARFSIVNNGTQDVTVTPGLRFTTTLPTSPTAVRVTIGPVTVPAGATHLVEIRDYLPPGLSGGVDYDLWAEADTGALLAQETRDWNNFIPLRRGVSMAPGCDT